MECLKLWTSVVSQLKTKDNKIRIEKNTIPDLIATINCFKEEGKINNMKETIKNIEIKVKNQIKNLKEL